MNKIMDEVFELMPLMNTQRQNLKRLKRLKIEIDILLESYESNLQLIEEQYSKIKKTIREIE
jgi:predicted  nucleic acid-binding Zn-ribbon protein